MVFLQRYNNLLLKWFTWLLNLSVILAVFSQFHDFEFSVFFSSDTLYLPSIYRDLSTDGHSIQSWHFNPAPNFFPDMSVYFCLMFLSGGNFIMASFVFAVLQYLFIYWLLVQLLKRALPEVSGFYEACISFFLSLGLFEGLYMTKDFYFTFNLISNSYHTGSFVMTLSCLLLVFSYFKKSSVIKLVALFLLVLLASLSDRLFTVFFVPPICVCLLVSMRHMHWTGPFTLLVIIALAVFTGLHFFYDIADSHYVYIDFPPERIWNIADVRASFITYKDQMLNYMTEHGWKCFALYS